MRARAALQQEPDCKRAVAQVIRNAKLWCDVESAAEAANLSQQWGITLVPGFTASKLAWLKKNEPGNWARLRHVLLPHDYLNHFLTSRFVMEVRTRMAARPSCRTWMPGGRKHGLGQHKEMHGLRGTNFCHSSPSYSHTVY